MIIPFDPSRTLQLFKRCYCKYAVNLRCKLSMAATYQNVEALAESMRHARKAKRLSYNALGKLARVDPGQANRICRGEFKRLGQGVLQICMVLDVDIPDGRSADMSSHPAAQKITSELMAAWDKTPEGAERLAQILRAVREYRSS